MEINIDNENKKNQEQLEKDKNVDDYTNYYNKKDYKVSLLNIDSAYRKKIPKNIYTSSINFLPLNPLLTQENSSIITINYPNHNLQLGDRVIIQNVQGTSQILNNALYLFQNYDYCVIQIKNNITPTYPQIIDNIKIEISLMNNILSENTTFYGNIPINYLLGIFNINIPSMIDIPQNILTYFNVLSSSEMNNNYLLIKLPFNYNSNNNNSLQLDIFVKATFYNLNGIPINYINADYPINFIRMQGYQEIYNVIDNNTFTINTQKLAYISGNGGGSTVQVMKIINTEDGFPDANNYKIKLKKSLNNVVRIELISSEFPFIDYLIKNSGSNKNNTIYWKHIDDGNNVYTCSIPEGNYDGTNLISTLQTNMNLVKRITSTEENPIYNNFIINYNNNTQEITFTSYKTTNIPYGLQFTIQIINNIQYIVLNILQPNNIVQINDIITISDAVGNDIVSASQINTDFSVYGINNSSSYYVLIGPVDQFTTGSDYGDLLTSNGGGLTSVKTNAQIQLLFNYQNTIGSVLGFKNAGQQNSITPYNNIISNFDDYIVDTNLDTVGNISDSNLLLNFTGNKNYYLLYINDYELVYNSSSILPCFAKILLSGLPNDILYNTFINYPLELDIPISLINELNIKITYGDGSLVDFRNIDHSFTIKITELIKYSKSNGINSKNTSYIETLKMIGN
jgi:hypothetical protein